jgi:hypothetical protein
MRSQMVRERTKPRLLPFSIGAIEGRGYVNKSRPKRRSEDKFDISNGTDGRRRDNADCECQKVKANQWGRLIGFEEE